MAEHRTTVRDVARLEVARVGRVEETCDGSMPFRLLDDRGVEVVAVTEFLHHMLADDASPASLRSYAYELLSWHRFLRAVEVPWHRAGRVEARDFALWLKTSKKPRRQRRTDAPAPGSVNPVTGKATPSANYAARTRRHARAVIRSFYEYHREMHGLPLVNPFPKARGADEEHLNAHHNPMQPFRRPSWRAAYQPKEPKPAPRSIPDQAFNELFAALDCNRDRALVAFYISTGARASELLGVCQGLVVPEEQVIGVVRKGSRALQQLPASTDAFVWLRLYQQEMRDLVPSGADEALWWTLRRPFRPLTYDDAALPLVSAYDVFEQTWSPPMPFLFQRRFGTEDRPITRSYIRECLVATSQAARITAADQPLEWRPHDFRRIFVTDAIRSGLPPHVAAKVCGHSTVDTTMGYAAIYPEDVIAHHRAFIARRRAERPSEEYRDLTTQEWDAFLAHFELRKVALGTCGRDHGTPCAHENACVRCPLLRVDPAQIPRLESIHANLVDRLEEAKEQGWLGEVAAIETTLAAAEQKLGAMRSAAAQRTTTVLGMPGLGPAAGRSSSDG